MIPFRSPSLFEACSFAKCPEPVVGDVLRTSKHSHRVSHWTPFCATHLEAFGWRVQGDGSLKFVGIGQ